MQTLLRKDNPFGYTRHGFLWEILKESSGGFHLDYGAYDGSVIRTLVETDCVSSAVGVEVNREVVSQCKDRMPAGAALRVIDRGSSLHFENNTFDSASLLDVLEHIADQKIVLGEVLRVLKPGGKLIVTVPGKHLFSFLDTGNFKFRFPRLHKQLYLRRHSLEEYDERYIDNPDGLIGDIEREKGWHQHFSRKELRELLEKCGFHVQRFDGSGYFTRIFLPFRLISPGFIKVFWDRILTFDAKLFSRANLFCLAEKPES